MSEFMWEDFLADDRYLSAPDSALVINPFPFETVSGTVKQADHYDRPSVPLNIGCCVPRPYGGVGDTWENTCVLYEEIPDKKYDEKQVLWQADTSDPALWQEEDGIYTAEFSASELVLSNLPEQKCYSHGISIGTISCNPNQTVLEVDIHYLQPGSRVSVTIRGGIYRHCLACIQSAGVYRFFLEDWSLDSVTTLTVHLRVYEGDRGALRLGGLRLWRVNSICRAAQSLSRRWHPAVLETEAIYPRKSHVTVYDYLADGETAVRRLSLHSTCAMWAAGRCDTATWDGKKLLITSGQQKAWLEFPEDVPVYFYDSVLEFCCGNSNSSPSAKTRFWALRFPCGTATYTLRFHYDVNEVRKEDNGPRFSYWQEWLDKVPPVDFEKMTGIAEPALLRRAYYTAWAQIIADVLPAQEGQKRCMTTGKASLWGYGDEHSPYAASWETFYGLMLLGRLKPEMAWEMYVDYMEMIGADGVLGGESLPSVKARTAWILHTIYPNREFLATVQPYLERYLKWRIHNLRWIYINRTPDEDEKDIDFVTSALSDVHYYISICWELGLCELASEWQLQSEALYDKFRQWFFPDGKLPVQKYYSDNGTRCEGFPLTIIKALHLPMLKESERKALLELFYSVYNPEKFFGGFRGIKLENMYDTICGLLMNGCQDDAYLMAKLSVKGILNAHFFAEVYDEETDGVVPEGVRPAIFGCALLIRCLWLLEKCEG